MLTRVLVCAGLLLLVAAAPARAQDARVIAERQVKDRVLELTVATSSFAAPTKLHVVLPTGYDADPARRWPVTYFTAGTMNRYSAFVNSGGVKLTEDYPSIVVAPDANSGYWSDWYNAGAFGPPKYETFVIDELLPIIDARFRTLADREHRLIFGISMGGYGATMLAARNPDLFSAAATLSGAVDSNLAVLAGVLSVSSTFDGAPPDAIYGPRATQEVRWRGHNPADLAENLRGLDLQVRTASGVPNPGIGEDPLSADSVSCVVELGVYQASISLHRTLDGLGIAHTWKDYGPGCHTPPNFRREIVDTLDHFKRLLAARRPAPTTFDVRRVERAFGVFGWRFEADPGRALEFLRVTGDADRVTLTGTGRTTVTSPPAYRGLSKVDVGTATVAPDADGRVRFTVDLGPPNTVAEFTRGRTAAAPVTRSATLRPHARIVVRTTVVRRGVRVCARALGADVRRARVRLLDARGRRAARSRVVALNGDELCRRLTRPAGKRRFVVTVRGRDRFGHEATARKAVRVR